jgi:hypothetical protein
VFTILQNLKTLDTSFAHPCTFPSALVPITMALLPSLFIYFVCVFITSLYMRSSRYYKWDRIVILWNSPNKFMERFRREIFTVSEVQMKLWIKFSTSLDHFKKLLKISNNFVDFYFTHLPLYPRFSLRSFLYLSWFDQ